MKLKKLLKAVGHNYSTVARGISLSPQAVASWEKHGVPAERVLAISQLTGISAHELRPDIYPIDNKG